MQRILETRDGRIQNVNFFDHIKNEDFFKPLTFKYRRIYYECIQILIRESKKYPVLYEADAKDSLAVYLNNLEVEKQQTVTLEKTVSDKADKRQIHENATEFLQQNRLNSIQKEEVLQDRSSQNGWKQKERNRKAERETPDLTQEDPEPETALQPAAILALFRACGWLRPREMGRNGEYVVTVSTDCRRIMDFLHKMTQKGGQGTMSNRIFSMYEIVKSASEPDSIRRERPYSNILMPLLDNESELKNELLDLKDNISDIMKAVIAFQDMNSLGQYIMKNEFLDRFFSEYFFIKNNGLIPTQIAYIRDRLRTFREDELYEKMLVECCEKQELTVQEARELLDRYFTELQYFVSYEYEENMELIDQRINSYYNLANTRIMLMASNGVRLETMLNDFLNVTAALPEDAQKEAFEKAAQCSRVTHQSYVGHASFRKYKRVKNEEQYTGLSVSTLTDEEKEARTANLFASAPNRYSVDRVSDYLEDAFGQKDEIRLEEQTLETRDEALMYAAAMLYSQNVEFPYKVEIPEEETETGIASISAVRILKKSAKKE